MPVDVIAACGEPASLMLGGIRGRARGRPGCVGRPGSQLRPV